MSRPTITASCVLALGLTALAGAASAQSADPASGQARTLTPASQYITWAGRGPAVMPEAVRTADAAPRRRSNAVIPHGGFASAIPMPQPEAVSDAPRRTLTPASAWTAPRPLPRPTPTPIAVAAEAPAAPPASVASVDLLPPPRAATYQPRIQPGPQPQRQAPPPVLPDYVPGQGGGQPAPAQAVYAEAPPAPADAPVYGAPATQPPADYDPMAPRRDAPIFRLQRPQAQAAPALAPAPESAPVAANTASASAPAAEAPAPRLIAAVAANPADHPSLQGSRRYSVHRQNGQQPDAVALPAPTYVDALAVTLTEMPASQDLAEPAPGPNLYRDAQGRVRAAPAASDGDHQ